jgi:hypothetical protein
VDASTPRGEWVLVVGPASVNEAEPSQTEIVAALAARLAAGADRRAAVAGVSGDLHLPKRDVYRLALSLKDPATGRTRPAEAPGHLKDPAT